MNVDETECVIRNFPHDTCCVGVYRGGEEQKKASDSEEIAANHGLSTRGWDWERQEAAFIIVGRGWGGKKRRAVREARRQFAAGYLGEMKRLADGNRELFAAEFLGGGKNGFGGDAAVFVDFLVGGRRAVGI